ncbi:hypothetical protein HHI36_021217 [Cryptolaemus montrouzieri]|uniref:Fatty acyl-CoA reductase n=1 Tax=Cryptolaemus montrouzieri TaxID=559131 RepID=A0ABD2MWA7_9CUCU
MPSIDLCIESPMASMQPTLSSMTISEFFQGKTVFITGGTGFMGKVLLEKLLRSCPGVSKVYLLIRPKKGQNAHERLSELLCSPLFHTVRKERPNDLYKVLPIEGDITQPDLAISINDRNMLARSVNIVFHSAATVKFDEKLKLSVTINVLGTQRLVELCKKMGNLEALIHVSTAYCNCNRTDVREVVYNPPMGPDQVTSLVECLDEDLVDTLTDKLLGDRPNTYTFTKALAESWLKENKGDLPLVIVRPSIVLSSNDGPLEGWVDNWNGPTGIIAAAGKGIFRTMLCDSNRTADLVPVDMVINLMLAAAWRIGTTKNRELQIYNCSTGQQKPITWKNFIGLCFVYMRKYPYSEVSWYPDGTTTSSKLLNTLNQYFLHWAPAYVMDYFLHLTGGKPMMIRIQNKLSKAAVCLEYFTTNEWKFDDENVKNLNKVLCESDRKEYNFNVAKIDWERYIENYVLGIRKYIFKEDIDSLPQARKNMLRLYWTYRSIQIISVLLMWRFLTIKYTPMRQMWSKALHLLIHLARLLPFL